MKCSVTFRHMKTSDPIREYAEEKVEKISKLLDRGGEARVTLSVEKHMHSAHVELVADGSLLMRGVDKSEDMYASIDSAVERIIRQVKRYRSKIQKHRPSPGRELPHQVFSVESDGEDELPRVPQIVREETIVARELSVDDALMQMDLLNESFLVFTNALTHKVNVLYRRADGDYGLIEPHAAA